MCFIVNVNLKAEGARQKMYRGFRGVLSLARNYRVCIETVFLEGVWGAKAHCSAALLWSEGRVVAVNPIKVDSRNNVSVGCVRSV